MKAKALCAVLVPVVVVSGYCLWPKPVNLDLVQKPSATTPAPAATPKAAESAEAQAQSDQPEAPSVPPAPPVPAQPIELATALEQQAITTKMTGNGREKLTVRVMNTGAVPLKVSVPVGQVFDNERSTVITVRPSEVEVAPGKGAELLVQTAAIRSSNVVTQSPYRISYRTIPRLEIFLTYIQDHHELTPATIQTTILALTDNLPLSAVAKFQMAGGALPSRFDTDAFRVENADIIAALSILRDLGVQNHAIAMTIDPQLRIEAMIDPLSRPAAMRYYGIPPEMEWDFWKWELMNGEPSTRHYALYGIARFYPEVAMQMLPKWVRETRTNPVYRLSAAQALADTQKPEALQILRQLAVELGETTELGKATASAAEYLDYRLAQMAASKASVAFRTNEEEVDL